MLLLSVPLFMIFTPLIALFSQVLRQKNYLSCETPTGNAQIASIQRYDSGHCTKSSVYHTWKSAAPNDSSLMLIIVCLQFINLVMMVHRIKALSDAKCTALGKTRKWGLASPNDDLVNNVSILCTH